MTNFLLLLILIVLVFIFMVLCDIYGQLKKLNEKDYKKHFTTDIKLSYK